MNSRFLELPRSLLAAARWQRLGPAQVPAMLVHPEWDSGSRVPVILWMHGRTVNKELDPGRYLRWLRIGVGACAVDLPGHGERFDPPLQEPERTLDVVVQMVGEIDGIVAALAQSGRFDTERIGVGGMSAGGMAAIARLCGPHPFTCASVEAASGSWGHQRERAMFRGRDPEEIARLDPLPRLEHWPEIPFQAIHARRDEWVSYEGQQAFIEMLRRRYRDPSLIEFIAYEETGAPFEHAGFGRFAAEAKDRQRDFFQRWLRPSQVAAASAEPRRLPQ